ncbi:MAG: hypothetical protein EP301_08770 [Gammaproteobacteria bacterium]|nr:MAG: hypothetical protein EP301_08770 [Gammaproteobacteria bacterium]
MSCFLIFVSLWAGVAWAEVASAEASPDPEAATEHEDAEAPAEGGLVFSPEVEAILNESSDAESYGSMERCIFARTIRGTRVLDDRHVVFELPSKKYYLVQFQNRCPQLRRNSAIAFEPTGSQLCRLDTIRSLDNFGSGPIGPPCSIPGFYEVTAEQVALLRETLEAERKRKPAQQ